MPDELTTPQPKEKVKRKYRKKAFRLFKADDAAFIQSQHVMRKHFINYLPQFIAHDPIFDAPFATNWQTKITECEELPTDDTNTADQTGIASRLQASVATLVKAVSDIEYYANKAFAHKQEVLYEFQFNTVNRPDQYKLQFIVNCVVIRMLAEDDYEAELLAAGMPPALITNLDNAIDQTSSLEMAHEKMKRLRIKNARIRVEQLNNLYKISQQVTQAAAVIFFNKPEERALFQ